MGISVRVVHRGLVTALGLCALLAGCKEKPPEEPALLIPGAVWLCGEAEGESCRHGFARAFGEVVVVSGGAQHYPASSGSFQPAFWASKGGGEWYEVGAKGSSPPALFDVGGELVAVLEYEAGTSRYVQYLARVGSDLKVGELDESKPWGGPTFVSGGKLRAVEQSVYGGLSGVGSWGRNWKQFDPISGQIKGGSLPIPESEPKAHVTSWVQSRTGDGRTRLISLALSTDRFCRVEVMPEGSYTFVWDCVPLSELPPVAEWSSAMRWGPYGPMRLLKTRAGNWLAATVSPKADADPKATVREGVLRYADFGAGPVSAVSHDHMDGLISDLWAIGTANDRGSHQARVVRVREDLSLEDLEVPLTPCTQAAVDLGVCENVSLAEVAPLGNGKHLAVYYVSTWLTPGSGGTSGLVVLEVSVKPADWNVPKPDAGTEPPAPGRPLFPEIMAACAHGVACGWFGYPMDQTYGGDVFGCAQALLETKESTALFPGTGRAELLACGQSAHSCRDFALCMNGGHDEAYCAAHPGASCDGTWAVECPAGSLPAGKGVECSATGNTCWEVMGQAQCGVEHPCPGAGQCDTLTSLWACTSAEAIMASAAKCPAGATCRLFPTTNGPVCVPDQPCAGNDHCEGDVWVFCDWLGELQFTSRTDCVRRGQACTLSGCWAERECVAEPDRCEGDVLRSCVLEQRVAFDCKAHGFARCGQSAQGVPTCLY